VEDGYVSGKRTQELKLHIENFIELPEEEVLFALEDAVYDEMQQKITYSIGNEDAFLAAVREARDGSKSN
jgi:hypothetical protein